MNLYLEKKFESSLVSLFNCAQPTVNLICVHNRIIYFYLLLVVILLTKEKWKLHKNQDCCFFYSLRLNSKRDSELYHNDVENRTKIEKKNSHHTKFHLQTSPINSPQ